MMSETRAVKVQGAEARIDEVRKRFVAHYVRVGAILFVLITSVWLVTVLGTWTLGGTNRAMVAVLAYALAWLLAWGYFVALILLTHRRTGLLWSIVIPGTRFNLLLLPLFLLIAVGFMMALNLPDSLRSFVIILAIYCSTYGTNWVLGKMLAPRDQVEAAAYGEHWLTLANVTLRDILLFRIPHERA
jgi:hypothetical protein